MRNHKEKWKRRKDIAFYTVLILILIVLTFPFIIMIGVSLKSSAEAISFPPTIIPKNFEIQHYIDIFNVHIFPFVKYFKNSLIITLLTCIIVVMLGIFGGYALARLKFTGRKIINEGFFFVYMFSGLLLLVPLYKIIVSLGLRDSLYGVVICMVVQTLPTAIYMTRSYFETVPYELEEAGTVDGLSRMGTIFKIMVPLSIPGLISVFVYAFMIAWNDVLFASILLDSPDNLTITIGLNSLFNTPDYIWGRMMAASIVTSLPIIVMYTISQRLIKSGATEGGVKG